MQPVDLQITVKLLFFSFCIYLGNEKRYELTFVLLFIKKM